MQYLTSEITHDRLQAQCFQYAWETYPQTRKMFFAALNEIPRARGESVKDHMLRVQAAKACGLVKGVFDLLFYWHGRIYAFDIKVGNDKPSPDQMLFCKMLCTQGGAGWYIDNFFQFKEIFDDVIVGKWGPGLPG